MPSKRVKRKFFRADGRPIRGRQAQFAVLAGVYRSAVSQWLSGKSPSERLDRLAKDWNPNTPAEPPASTEHQAA
ncbi:MAG: helix-turn-helix domain-containing protein [Candidatus Methylomirabilales bacterium]